MSLAREGKGIANCSGTECMKGGRMGRKGQDRGIENGKRGERRGRNGREVG